ncbi:PREDICTED: protein SHOOT GRAVITROPISM 5 isoform X1 [Camelina sativa]|uniref:Protein SHOOT GRAVITROPISM 5 isoform X1 n=2 Tax=Camelina sativa TaxID=90675 RepID=A0ABM0YK06_CAMSA|nr:PREDICTED: protein SHOOT GRAVITROPISM 5 isoform X1 [Camelina sativa]
MRTYQVMLSNKNTNTCCVVSSSSSDPFLSSSENGVTTTNTSTQKRKRRPAGTPDPDAEVVSLSPRTLLESDRYICEICNQGFQRDQNLQMHRRRHKVPWKLLKRDNNIEVKKRVYVCPEPTCLHHDPCHALGDLVGIKKHFRRKHSNHKQWVCERCSKGYAVQSDYKAHLKTCGTRGHSCDCGRVFSRVESFIEHQDNCSVRRVHREQPLPPQTAVPVPACSSRTASTISTPSSETNYGGAIAVATPIPLEGRPIHQRISPSVLTHSSNNLNLELQLLPLSSNQNPNHQENQQQKVKEPSHHHNHNHDATNLNLSIAPSSSSYQHYNNFDRIKEIMASEQIMKIAMKEKAYAEEAKREAKRQREIAENEFANAKKIRQKAQAELERAKFLKEQSMKKISSTIMQVTCQTCKGQFQAVAVPAAAADETSLVVSYMSSANTDGDFENGF